MVIAYCPGCDRMLDAYIFENSDRCPYCGKSFIIVQYVVLTIFSIFCILISWVVYWWFSNQLTEKVPLFATGLFIILVVINIIIDQILLRTTDVMRIKRKGIAIYLSMGLTMIVAYIMKPYIMG